MGSSALRAEQGSGSNDHSPLLAHGVFCTGFAEQLLGGWYSARSTGSHPSSSRMANLRPRATLWCLPMGDVSCCACLAAGVECFLSTVAVPRGAVAH